jgi:hypothetical protein
MVHRRRGTGRLTGYRGAVGLLEIFGWCRWKSVSIGVPGNWVDVVWVATERFDTAEITG